VISVVRYQNRVGYVGNLERDISPVPLHRPCPFRPTKHISFIIRGAVSVDDAKNRAAIPQQGYRNGCPSKALVESRGSVVRVDKPEVSG
jgi:hypothetical protein